MSTSVLIVGAGPTGLTLACELARRRVSFRLIEASAGPQPGSRGKGLQPRTLEVLEDLGILDRILEHGQMAVPMRLIGPDGQEQLVQTDAESHRPDVPYAASVIIPEWRTEELLRQCLAELGGEVEFGTALSSFEQSDEGVTAILVKDGAEETVTAHWLAGCDGGHSSVRKQAGIVFEGETREDVRAIVADVHVDGLERDAWHIWRHPEGLVMLCPLPSTPLFQYLGAIAPGQDPELSLANLQDLLGRRTGRADIRLRDAEWLSLWRANVRLAQHYRAGRAFLAGDAAHIHSPAGGQGMNTGIQDAYNLGWKLAAVEQGLATQSLLDSYEAERRPVAAGVLALSDARLAQVVTEQNFPVQRTEDTTQLSVNYRGCDLFRDDRDETARLRAGDRAPDATGLETAEGPRRLFELTRGDRFTLLSFGAVPDLGSSPWNVRILRVPSDIVYTGGHLAAAYGAKEGTLVLIRPDGYIGLISDRGDISAVSDYLEAIGR